MEEVILVGGFPEMIELVESCGKKVYGIIDNKSCGDYKILGSDDDIHNITDDVKNISLILVPDQPKIRRKLHVLYSNHNFIFSKLQSNKARVSESAQIKMGVVIQSGVNISTNVILGNFVKLNTGCNIMHDSIIGDYTTVAPNAVILGSVEIGNCCYIGSNSTILPTIKICNDVTIGAGAVVTKNISEPGVYVGMPARLMKKSK